MCVPYIHNFFYAYYALVLEYPNKLREEYFLSFCIYVCCTDSTS